ncbi:LysR family transcriptional regulator [Nocardioides salsibiostraticola]
MDELGLRRLRMLREVAHHGGVTAAGLAMHYAPSGISQQIKALENDLGAAVLERSGRGVRLTEVGRILLEHAEILLGAEQEARAAVERARGTLAVELRVGVFCTVAASLMPRVIADLAARHPEVRLTTRETDPDDAPLDLRHGHLDLAFLLDYPDAPEPWMSGLTLVPAGMDEVHLAAPAGWFNCTRIDLADLADCDWVMSGLDNYYGRAMRSACRQAGFDPRVVHEVDEQPTALAMVAAGLGVTLMSDLGRAFLPAEGVDVLEIAQTVRRQVLVACDQSADSRPAVSAFLQSVRRNARAAGLSQG